MKRSRHDNLTEALEEAYGALDEIKELRRIVELRLNDPTSLPSESATAKLKKVLKNGVYDLMKYERFLRDKTELYLLAGRFSKLNSGVENRLFALLLKQGDVVTTTPSHLRLGVGFENRAAVEWAGVTTTITGFMATCAAEPEKHLAEVFDALSYIEYLVTWRYGNIMTMLDDIEEKRERKKRRLERAKGEEKGESDEESEESLPSSEEVEEYEEPCDCSDCDEDKEEEEEEDA